jgi:hypothetical protein
MKYSGKLRRVDGRRVTGVSKNRKVLILRVGQYNKSTWTA